MTTLNNFLYPHSRYRGNAKPENLVFNANLQEFSQRVSYICGLETNGKLTPNEAVQRIESLWYQLQQSQQQLGI
ncbi:MAG: hypothetical protein ACAF41_01495 [Leptolyngbya sp. BL-A-14]